MYGRTDAGCRLGEMSSQLVPDGVRVRLSSLSSSAAAAAASAAVNYSDVMSTDTCWRLCQCDGLLHDCTQQYTYDLPHASIIYYSTVSVTCTVQPKITHVEIRVFFLVVDKIRFIHLEVIQY